MEFQSTLGLVASFVTVASFVPQVIKAWKSGKVRDLSYAMLGLLLLSGILWTGYGVLISDLPVIITNVCVAFLNLAILTAKIRYDKP